jgi:hypothetical protein
VTTLAHTGTNGSEILEPYIPEKFIDSQSSNEAYWSSMSTKTSKERNHDE